MTGLLFTIVSSLFILLLSIAYFSKKGIQNLRVKMYSYLLIAEMFLIVSEIVSTVFIVYGNSRFLSNLFLRVHWYTVMMWFTCLYYYSIAAIGGMKKIGLRSVIIADRKSKAAFIVLLILNIVFFFVPLSEISNSSSLSYLPGYAAYYTYFYGGICIYLITLYFAKNEKTAPKNTKLSIFAIMLLTIIVLIFQFWYQSIAIETIITSLYLYFLYFNNENPDLELISEVASSKEEIDKSSKAKTDFLSNMSHEIRSPMNAIIGFSDSLVNGNFDVSTVRNDIININQAGNNLLDIINNILDISKIETGKETIEMKEYYISNILDELQKIVETRLDVKPIKYIVNIDNNMPCKYYGDSVKLFQILLNILTNSVKYTEVGKIILSLNCEINGDYALLHFKVSDTGYGIKKEDFDKLFEKFSRLDIAVNKEIEGTGLGLLITKKYVDLMGGKIWFDSKLHVGTNFYIDVTQKIADKTSIKDMTLIKARGNSIDLLDCSMYSILLVDDNKLNLKVAHKLLGKYNFKIDEVTSGKECIDLIKNYKKYDLIFLDHMMPELDGIEVLHILKGLDGYDIPPIVVLTANAISGMKERYLKEGFDDYLSKPINIGELNKLVVKYFSK